MFMQKSFKGINAWHANICLRWVEYPRTLHNHAHFSSLKDEDDKCGLKEETVVDLQYLYHPAFTHHPLEVG